MPNNPLLQGLRELANHLGGKLDTLINKNPKIEIDLGESSKSLTEAAKSLDTVSKLIAQNEKGRDFSGVQSALMKVSSDISSVASSMSAVLRQVSSSESKSVSTLGKLLTATMANKPKEIKIDLSSLEKQMKETNAGIAALQKEISRIDMEPYAKGMEMLAEAWKGLKFEFPKEFKLNEMQVKQMAYGGGGGSISVAGGLDLATSPTIERTTLTLANTEYTYVFPSKTISFYIKAESQSVKLLYAWTTGTLPTSGTGASYMTTPQNFIQSRERAAFGNKTIYLQCATAGTVVEIESFQI